MNIQNVLYKILYIGFIYEKGSHKKRGARLKTFNAHVKLWNIISLILSSRIMNIAYFKSMITLIKSDKHLKGIYYLYLESIADDIDYTFPMLSDKQQQVQNFMIKLLIILNMRYDGEYSNDLHVIIRGLHNLPKCFLIRKPPELPGMYVSPELCLEYSYSNLSADFINDWNIHERGN